MEAGIRNESKRISNSGWVRLYGAVSPGGYYYDLVRAIIILAIFASTGGAALQILAHWWR